MISKTDKSDLNKIEFSEVKKGTEIIDNLAKQFFLKLTKTPGIAAAITFSAAPIALSLIIYGFTSIAFAELLIPAFFISLLLIVSYFGARTLIKTFIPPVEENNYKMPEIIRCISNGDKEKLNEILKNEEIKNNINKKEEGKTPLYHAVEMYYFSKRTPQIAISKDIQFLQEILMEINESIFSIDAKDIILSEETNKIYSIDYWKNILEILNKINISKEDDKKYIEKIIKREIIELNLEKLKDNPSDIYLRGDLVNLKNKIKNLIDEKLEIIKKKEQSFIEIIKILLENGANIDVKSNFGTSFLFEIIKGNDLEMFKILLEPHRLKNSLYFSLESDIKKPSKFFNEIFLFTVQNRNQSITEYLLKHFNKKIDVNYQLNVTSNSLKIEKNKTPLQIAFEKNYLDMIRLLLKQKNIDVDNKSKNFLYIAIEKFPRDIIDLILGKIKNFEEESLKNCLSLAIDKKDMNTIKALLEKNVSIDQNEKLCNIFLKPNFNDKKMLKCVLKAKYSKLLNLLLYKIASKNNENLLNHLKELTQNINLEFLKKDTKTDNLGNNALHIAIEKDNVALIEFLINSKAIDIEAKNSSYKTPLIMAVKKNKLEAVKLLINADANIEAKNSSYKTSLLISARKDINSDMTKFLIEKGANKNAKDAFGNSYNKILENENKKMKKMKIPKNLLEAVEAGNFKKVKEFLKSENINQKQLNKAIEEALGINNESEISKLLWTFQLKN